MNAKLTPAADEAVVEMDAAANQQHLFAHLARVERVLRQRLQSTDEIDAFGADDDLSDDEDAAAFADTVSPLADPRSRLGQVVTRFGLSALEQDLLLLAAIPHADGRYASLFADMQDDRQLRLPTLDLARSVLENDPQAWQQAWRPSGPLQVSGLLTLTYTATDRQPLHSRAMLQLDVAIYTYLLGGEPWSSELDGGAHWLPPLLEGLPPDAALRRALNEAHSPLRLAVQSPYGEAADLQVSHTAAQAGLRLLRLNLAQTPSGEKEAQAWLQTALREAQCRGGGLLLVRASELQTHHPRLQAWLEMRLLRYPPPVIVLQTLQDSATQTARGPQLVLTLAPLTPEHYREWLQARLKQACGKWAKGWDATRLEGILSRFPLAPCHLPHLAAEADSYRRLRQFDSPLQADDLIQALSRRAQQSFGALAQRIAPKRDLADLVVTADLHQHLQELLAALRHRESTLNQGFAAKLHYGLGICALFHGPSGTGKTMAAEVLARELGTDLVRIDLSTVVNKYIGETEKHLARIFDLAEHDSGVLFFDEADALFGKRSETKDAHDRHANIEVSYLLQRLENHPGLVILSTNHRNHLDQAFSRRFTFVLRFTPPDESTREQLWRQAWPDGIRLAEDVTPAQLSTLAQLTGANIRNIALLSTWLAREECAPAIAWRHIRHALSREQAKIGQLATN